MTVRFPVFIGVGPFSGLLVDEAGRQEGMIRLFPEGAMWAPVLLSHFGGPRTLLFVTVRGADVATPPSARSRNDSSIVLQVGP